MAALSGATADNQNTNQNEAFTPPSKEASIVTDSFQNPPRPASTTTIDMAHVSAAPTSEQGEPANTVSVTKSSKSLYESIPTIEITPVSPNEAVENFGDYENANSLALDSDQSENKSISLGMDCLRPPPVDTTINIARPKFEDNLNVSRVVDNANDEDIEVVCRYSSTPVLSTSRNMDDSDVSMLSISSASPIVPVEISTPAGKSNNHSAQPSQSIIESGKTFVSQGQHNKHHNVLFGDCQVVPQQTRAGRESLCCSPFAPHISHGDEGAVGGVGGAEKAGYIPHNSLPAPPFTPGQGSYFPYSDGSWTDLSYRGELSPVPTPPQSLADPCCFAALPGSGCMGGVSADAEYFVYPSIYVSSAGLISVLLRGDISVEMTVDRTIRVVSHNHMMAVATDSRGTAACLYHPAVKVFQTGTTTDIATHTFRSQMGDNDCIVFSNGTAYFRLEGSELQPTAPIKFMDIMRDQSVNLLFSSEGYGEALVASCMQVAAQAEYANLPKGGVIVRINGVKVTQTGGGDVTVVTGAKFIRLSPNSGTTRLGNRFVDVEVEKDWSVKLTRGTHSFAASKKRATVCNGKMEAGFDEHGGLKVTNLAPRHPLLAEPSMVRRPPPPPPPPAARKIPQQHQQYRQPPGITTGAGLNPCGTPKRRLGPPTYQGGGYGARWGAGGLGSI